MMKLNVLIVFWLLKQWLYVTEWCVVDITARVYVHWCGWCGPAKRAGECGAGVRLICESRETGSCLPVCQASICTSQFTPPSLSLLQRWGTAWDSAGLHRATDYQYTHTYLNHLCYMGKEHPTYRLMRFTASVPTYIIQYIYKQIHSINLYAH